MVDTQVQGAESRAKARTRPKKGALRRRPFWLPILTFLLRLGIVLATLVALALTAYLVLSFLRPDLIQRLPIERLPFDDNLTAGVIFFWLEVFVVAFGLKAVDAVSTLLAARNRFYDLYTILKPAVEAVWDERYRFAVTLDENKRPDGGYDVDLGQLNIAINKIRTEFTYRILCDPGLNDHGRFVADRALRILDLMATHTYDLSVSADPLNARHETIEGQEGEAEAPSPETSGPEGHRPELEADLEKMFEYTDPKIMGLERLLEGMRQAAVKLKIGAARIEDAA